MAAAAIRVGHNVYRSTQKDDSMRRSLRSFKELADSLKSDDLEGARKAFAMLRQSLQQAAPQSQNGEQAGARDGQQGTMLQQLGKVLDGGDLGEAQRMFENLMRGGSTSTGDSETGSGCSSGHGSERSVPYTGGKIDVIV